MTALRPDQKINVVLMGEIGTGKTSSIKTILRETDKKVYVIATEPGIHTILNEMAEELGAEDRLHWAYVAPASTPWEVLIKTAGQVNKLPPDALQKAQMSKSDYQQFIELLGLLADFRCERPDCPCGNKSHGPVDDFGPDVVLVMDGLSGLSRMAMDLVTGAKPLKTLPDWGIAQDTLRRLLDKLTNDTKCSFVLIAHLEKKQDLINGGTHLTVSTLGQALSGDIPKPFDEVIYVHREQDKFFWSTIETKVAVKTRCLPFDDEIRPTFAHFFGAAG